MMHIPQEHTDRHIGMRNVNFKRYPIIQIGISTVIGSKYFPQFQLFLTLFITCDYLYSVY